LGIGASAYFEKRAEGPYAVTFRSLFLMGVCGLSVLSFFIVVSMGAVFQISECDALFDRVCLLRRGFPAQAGRNRLILRGYILTTHAST
jgi:hypothetical protein